MFSFREINGNTSIGVLKSKKKIEIFQLPQKINLINIKQIKNEKVIPEEIRPVHKINSHFNFKQDINRMKNLIKPPDELKSHTLNDKMDFRNIIGFYKVFKKEESKSYKNEYMSKIFRLLHKKDNKNYYVNRKVLKAKSERILDICLSDRSNKEKFSIPIKLENKFEELINYTVTIPSIAYEDFSTLIPTSNKKEMLLKNSFDSDFSISDRDFNDSFKKKMKRKLFYENDFYIPNTLNKQKLFNSNESKFNQTNSHNYYVKNELVTNKTSKIVNKTLYPETKLSSKNLISSINQNNKKSEIKLNLNKKYVFGGIIDKNNSSRNFELNLNSKYKINSNNFKDVNYSTNSQSQSIKQSFINTKIKTQNLKLQKLEDERLLQIKTLLNCFQRK